MEHLNVTFLEAYKDLDDLCGQLLSCTSGVDEYLKQMEEAAPRARHKIGDWESDCEALKEYQEIRNRLVHEPGSFSLPLVAEEDVTWLSDFRARILVLDDPFGRLRATERPAPKGKTTAPADKKKATAQPRLGHVLLGGAAALAAASAVALRVFKKKDPPSRS